MRDGRLDPGDDVARLVDHHLVAQAQIAAGDVGRVVQGGVPDGRPVDLHGLEHGARGDDAGPADIPLDPQEAGDLLDGGELVRDGPARRPRPGTRLALVGRQVRLDHDAVDPERQRGAQRGDVLDPGLHLLGRTDGARRHRRVRRRVHAESGDELQDLAVREFGQGAGQLTGLGQCERSVREEGHLDAIGPVLGAEGARRPVARVGEGGAAVLRAYRIGLLELLVGHEDLAAHLDGDRRGEPLGQAEHRADRMRHVLMRRFRRPG